MTWCMANGKNEQQHQEAKGCLFFSCGIDFQVILIDDMMKLGRMETMLKVSSKILDIYIYVRWTFMYYLNATFLSTISHS